MRAVHAEGDTAEKPVQASIPVNLLCSAPKRRAAVENYYVHHEKDIAT